MKKQVRSIKLRRETVAALTAPVLAGVAGGGLTYTCTRNNNSCVASCSDVPCN